MKSVKFTALLAAASLAVAPTASYGAAVDSLAASARAGATMNGSSSLNGDSRSTQITLGFLVLVAILVVALTGGDNDGPASP